MLKIGIFIKFDKQCTIFYVFGYVVMLILRCSSAASITKEI